MKAKMKPKRPKKFFIDWDEIRSNANKLSSEDLNSNNQDRHLTLQESFLQYRRKKQAAMVQAENMARKNRKKFKNAQRCRMLRIKFLEQCIKYIGVPYKRKFHEVGSAEYNSELFLDCCGLVRRAMRDLKEEFGFEIGPWNQAYMYDTLPGTFTNAGQMKAGDLVFITGRYFNEKCRRQLHDVVHVEIWMGDGLKTIGARWHRGKVQIFDDYRFESTSYHSMRYHFKSIDPWLQGKCESCCTLHAWRRLSDKPRTRSVFNVQSSTNNPQDIVQEEMAYASDEDVSDEITKEDCEGILLGKLTIKDTTEGSAK